MKGEELVLQWSISPEEGTATNQLGWTVPMSIMDTGLPELNSTRYYGRTDCIHNGRRYPGRNHRSTPEAHSSANMGTAKGALFQVSRLARAEQSGSCDSISVDTCGRCPDSAATGNRSYIALGTCMKLRWGSGFRVQGSGFQGPDLHSMLGVGCSMFGTPQVSVLIRLAVV